MEKGTSRVKRGFAEMFKGGVIMDVTTSEQAKIAEDAGAVAVMALEKIPADIRKEGGVARTAPLEKIIEIQETVSIPVMAKVRIGHEREARVLESIKVDYIDESEVLTPADKQYHIDKSGFTVPFVCGARDLGEALRRINEGASMIRTKGEAGTGNVIHAVEHMRLIRDQIAELVGLYEMSKELEKKKLMNHRNELTRKAQEYKVPVELIYEVAEKRRLPVVNFAAGGIATPQDAAHMMYMGADGVFVGSGIFKSDEPGTLGEKIVKAVACFKDMDYLKEASENFGTAMVGQGTIPEDELIQHRDGSD